MDTVWVFQHLEAEPPGLIATVLEEEGAGLSVFRADRGELPAALAPTCRAVVAMGGPMAVYDAPRIPWMNPEIELLRAALARGLPILAVCLGSQLLAAAAGARVYPGGRAPEIGWDTVRLTPEGAADPLSGTLTRDPGGRLVSKPGGTLAEKSGPAAGGGPGGEHATVFQWHGDTFDLPPEAVLLAGSAAYPHQAFRLGRAGYGFQFHFEVSPETIATWLDLWPDDLAAAGQTAQAVRQDSARHGEGLARRGRELIRAFAARVLPP